MENRFFALLALAVIVAALFFHAWRLGFRFDLIRQEIVYAGEKLHSLIPSRSGRRLSLCLKRRKGLFNALEDFYETRDSFPDRWFLKASFGRIRQEDFANPVFRREWPFFEKRMTSSLIRRSRAIQLARQVQSDRVISEIIEFAEDDFQAAAEACRIARHGFGL